jgi:hypothetical protein
MQLRCAQKGVKKWREKFVASKKCGKQKKIGGVKKK